MYRALINICFLCCACSVFAQDENPLWGAGQNVTIRNVADINTTHLEFSPAFYSNGIVYVSSKRQSGGKDKNINESYFELFYAEYNADFMPTRPKPFSCRVEFTSS